jgi:hypothetical protein
MRGKLNKTFVLYTDSGMSVSWILRIVGRAGNSKN